jgi:hypothetical protein
MRFRILGLTAAAVVAGALLAGRGAAPAAAQTARELFDFEQDTGGFIAVSMKDGQFGQDGDSTVALTQEKSAVKQGASSLSYAYKIEPKVLRLLSAETKLPAGTQRVEAWVRSTVGTHLVMSLREADGSSYDLGFFVAPHEWTRVVANLDEFRRAPDNADENNRLDAAQVSSIAFMDIANMLAFSEEVAKALPGLAGPRQLWLDDLRFAAAKAPLASGELKEGENAFVVDNFENGLVRWMFAKILFAGPTFEIFPPSASLRVLAEAAGPGMARTPVEPGGKGLRYTYTRAAQEAFALVCNLERVDLARADRLRLSINASQKSLLIIQIEEKDGSKYNHAIMPDDSVGWRNLDLDLKALALSDDSKDENGMLDPGQIKEISILDASAFVGGGQGDTTIDLDAISFRLQ